VTQFLGPEERLGSERLDYEEALNALLSLIGRQVLVFFSGAEHGPFIGGIIAGRLDRGELDERLQTLLLRTDPAFIETIFFHVGSRQSGFVVRPDEFVHAFWQTDKQLTVRVGDCAITVLIDGDLGEALHRG
jgi:hypothetical protein